jgi:hypothetical protein
LSLGEDEFSGKDLILVVDNLSTGYKQIVYRLLIYEASGFILAKIEQDARVYSKNQQNIHRKSRNKNFINDL